MCENAGMSAQDARRHRLKDWRQKPVNAAGIAERSVPHRIRQIGRSQYPAKSSTVMGGTEK
jgi:hypothetical protein